MEEKRGGTDHRREKNPYLALGVSLSLFACARFSALASSAHFIETCDPGRGAPLTDLNPSVRAVRPRWAGPRLPVRTYLLHPFGVRVIGGASFSFPAAANARTPGHSFFLFFLYLSTEFSLSRLRRCATPPVVSAGPPPHPGSEREKHGVLISVPRAERLTEKFNSRKPASAFLFFRPSFVFNRRRIPRRYAYSIFTTRGKNDTHVGDRWQTSR